MAVAGVGPELTVLGSPPFAVADETALEAPKGKKLPLAGMDMAGTGVPKLTVRASAGEDKAGTGSR